MLYRLELMNGKNGWMPSAWTDWFSMHSEKECAIHPNYPKDEANLSLPA
jgi:hypothetical protein